MAELINEPASEARLLGQRRIKSLGGNRRWWRLFRDCAAVPCGAPHKNARRSNTMALSPKCHKPLD
jgi:hypothetical protein